MGAVRLFFTYHADASPSESGQPSPIPVGLPASGRIDRSKRSFGQLPVLYHFAYASVSVSLYACKAVAEHRGADPTAVGHDASGRSQHVHSGSYLLLWRRFVSGPHHRAKGYSAFSLSS